MKINKILLFMLLSLLLIIIYPQKVEADLLPGKTTCIFGCGELGKEKPIENLYCENIYTENGYNYYKDQDTIWNINEIVDWTQYQAKLYTNIKYIHNRYNYVNQNYQNASPEKLKELYNVLTNLEARIIDLETDKDFPCYFYATNTIKGYSVDKNIAKSQIADLKQKISNKYQSEQKWGCEMLLGANFLEKSKTYKEIKKIVNIIKIAIPTLLIALGTFDIAKAVTASDEEKMKEAQMIFIKRTIIAVAIFFIPTIVTIIIGLMSNGVDVCNLGNL